MGISIISAISIISIISIISVNSVTSVNSAAFVCEQIPLQLFFRKHADSVQTSLRRVNDQKRINTF